MFRYEQNLNSQSSKTKLWQPRFPLKYSDNFGPYEPITNIYESLNRNFINLVLTNPGEWPMNPDLGIGIRQYLFENYNSPKLDLLKPSIISQLDKYLSRVKLIDLEFKSTDQQKDEHYLKIILKYSILGNSFIGTGFFIGEDGFISVAEIIRKTNPEAFSNRPNTLVSDLTVF